MLLEAGASHALQDNGKHTAAELAKQYRQKAIVKLFADLGNGPRVKEAQTQVSP